jgi:4-hydroxy-3-methylbut-2-enyl diphosphate reductase
MQIKIDDSAGFCWGVVRTIDITEKTLAVAEEGENVYVLGHIIHNPREIERLAAKGLKTIDHLGLEHLAATNERATVLIRAHGEPPSTFQLAEDLGIKLVDATCPLVTGLQNRVKRYYDKGYQVVIYGKPNHAEVIGLRGMVNDNCVIILNEEEALEKVDFSRPTVLFSQTTMEKYTYYKIRELIEKNIRNFVEGGDTKDDYFQFKNSLCKEVWGRDGEVVKFAKENDIVIFVAGRNSSNGKSLFKHMNQYNPSMYYIEDIEELDWSWFEGKELVGITGATSTPQWYLEKVKSTIQEWSEAKEKVEA